MLRWRPAADGSFDAADRFDAGPDPADDPGRRWVRILAAAVFVVVLFVHERSPNVTVADSIRFVPAAESLVARGSFDVRWSGELPNGGQGNTALYQKPGDLTAPIYPYYPLGPVLVAAPVVLAQHVLAGLGVTPSVEEELRTHGTWRLERLVASIVIALAALVMCLVGYERAIGSPARRLAVGSGAALVFAFATPAWTTGSRALWQHGPVMLMLSIALLLARRADTRGRGLAPLGVVLGFAYVTRPTAALAVVAFTAWAAVRHRHRLSGYLSGLGVVLLGLGLVNRKLYGSILSPYYRPGREGSNPHPFDALAGNLVSPGRGLFTWSPILLLGLVGAVVLVRRRRVTALDVTVWLLVAAHWVAISLGAPQWWGGYTIGPRLFSDVVPLLVFMALPLFDEVEAAPGRPPRWTAAPRAARVAAAAGVLVLLVPSVLVEVEGAFLRAMWCWNKDHTVDETPSAVWLWRDGQLFAGLDAIGDGSTLSVEATPGLATTSACVPPPGPSAGLQPSRPATARAPRVPSVPPP